MYVSEDTFIHLRQAADEQRNRELEYRRIAQERGAGTTAGHRARPAGARAAVPPRGVPPAATAFAHVTTLVADAIQHAGRAAALPVRLSGGRGTMGICEPRSAPRWSAGMPTSTRSATPMPRASPARPEPCSSGARRASARPASWASSSDRFRRRRSCCAVSRSTSTATRRRTLRSSRRSARSHRRSARRRCSTHRARRATRSPCSCPS